MDFYKHKTSQIREKRLGTISAYYGNAETILNEINSGNINQRIRTFSQDIFSDIQYAVQLLSTIRDIAIVVHGPAGCSLARFNFDLSYDDSVKVAVTNLNERDSIMGSEVKLKDAIKQVYSNYSPKLIFIVTTPVVAINNDDVDSVADEFKADNNINVIPLYTDGFRSKTGISGYDAALHAIIKNLLPKKLNSTITKGNFINLLSISENINDIKELIRLLNSIGLPVNILPRFSSIENFTKSPDALVSVTINPDESNYLGGAISEKYGIPLLQPPLPLGIKKTSEWINQIAKVFNLEEAAGKVIIEEVSLLEKFLENHKYTGKKIFINLPPAYAFEIIEFLEDLGFETVAVKVPYLDKTHIHYLEKFASEKSELPILVGEGQSFEDVNAILKTKPDLYICLSADSDNAIKEGVPVIDIGSIPVLGYKGVYNLIENIERKLTNLSFVSYLSDSKSNVYADSWLQKKPNWYIKQEVK